jgi:hypothetical protein
MACQPAFDSAQPWRTGENDDSVPHW